MGQVPDFGIPPLGVVGDGRVARHVVHYCNLLGVPVRTWSRRASRNRPPEALAACHTVLLLISDDAIAPFVGAWPSLQEKQLVHFSGSLVTPGVVGMHPLMTFGPNLYEPDEYRAIPFVGVEGSPPLSALLLGWPNPSFTIRAEDRPYYHALCVMAGNFSTLLWLKLFDELARLAGMPATSAHPYLARMAANVMTHGRSALTGPLVRGDTQTVAANLAALEGDSYHAVYAAFVRAYDQHS